MANYRLLKVILILLIVVMVTPFDHSQALGAGAVYKNPIAFVRGSEIAITNSDGDTPTRIIYPEKTSTAHFLYGRPQWSPDGNQVITSEYSQKDDGAETMRLIRLLNGDRLESFLSITGYESGHMTTIPMVWTQSGEEIAYFNGIGIFLMPATGGQPKLLYTPNIARMIGEGPGEGDPAARLDSIEQEANPLFVPFHLINTAYGLLVGTALETPDGGVDTWGMVSLDGKLLWTANFSTTPIVSPDGKQAIVGYDGPLGDTVPAPDSKPVVLVDLKTGKVTPTKIQPGGIPLGWGVDGKAVFVGVQSKVAEVTGIGDSPVGQVLFPDTWPVMTVENTLTLWWYSMDNPGTIKPIKLFETRGHSFGVMTVGRTDDLPIVFSIVSSSLPMIESINKGATQEEAKALLPTVELYALDVRNSEIRWKMPGGRPSYGTADFWVAVSPQ